MEGTEEKGEKRTFYKGLPWSIFLFVLFYFILSCMTNQHNSCIIISINQLPWDRNQGRGKKYPFTLLASGNET